ncbi:Alpha-glucosidase [Naganishia friedmannii]|uniref:Alpha-glucosidase n=1 Tax=Naganishia friedmannii TaxID=89922 RepID=A0ACC2WAK4_9TREE|nr:Alpha-glucosidase [Naganishia friedmannii]
MTIEINSDTNGQIANANDHGNGTNTANGHVDPDDHHHDRVWWKDAVIYQIYPSSYKDSNGDGMGDIPGIISKLDYLKDLGIDCVWLNPHYKSPQIDMGYDISDYQDIHEPYGSLEDCMTLIKGCHDRGIKIVFDLVVNHTSDQHKWFQESRSSKENPKRDWYIWRKPSGWDENGKPIPPCNWRAAFGGSVWEWDEPSQEYYLHLFAVEQPDLVRIEEDNHVQRSLILRLHLELGT